MPAKTFLGLILLTVAVMPAPAQTKDPAQTNAMTQPAGVPLLKVTSSSFKDGEMMPIPYTCHGVNISPALDWEGAPKNTETFVVMCEDPDASYKSFNHWVVYNIPKDAKGLPEKVPAIKQMTNGAQQGLNDFRKLGYKGPCPPSGVHRYYFRVYALNGQLLLLGDVTKDKVLDAMKGRVLAQGQIMAKYGR